MKLHGDKNEPEDARRLGNLRPQQQSTNQQVILPVFSGEAKLPCMWIGSAYDQFSKKAPLEKPAKK